MLQTLKKQKNEKSIQNCIVIYKKVLIITDKYFLGNQHGKAFNLNSSGTLLAWIEFGRNLSILDYDLL